MRISIHIVAVVSVCIMTAIGIFVYGADVCSLSVFFAFLLFYVQLPGLFIIRSLKINFDHISTTLAVSFFAGWGAEIILYFISDLLTTDVLLYSVGPLISFFYLYDVFKSRKGFISKSNFSIERLSIAFSLFAILVLLYSLLNTQYIYMSPEISDYTYINPDKAYHMGLIASLSHDYPLQSPWIQGVYIYYHIFAEILYSIPCRLFDINPDTILMTCAPYMTTYCLCISMYSFFRELSSHKNRAGIYCLIILISNIFIVRNIRTSIAFTFAIINDNSTGYGISACMMTVIVFRYWYKEFTKKQPSHLKLFLLVLLFIMLSTGIKGPIGAVLVFSLWGVFFLGLLLKKADCRILIPLLLITAAFFLIYFTILGSKGQTGGGNSLFAFANISGISFWKKPLAAFMKALSIPKPIRLSFMLVVFLLFMLTAFFLPFCLGYIREFFLVVTRRKEFDFVRIWIYAAFLVGFIAMFILNYSGRSQIYFGFVSVFFSPLIAFWFFEDMEKQSSLFSRRLYKVTFLIFIISLVLTSASLTAYYNRHISKAIRHTDPNLSFGRYVSISNKEYEAMTWIESNTPEDSIFATNRYASVAPDKYSFENRWSNRFFLYAAYSNRFYYISGSGYNLKNSDWMIRKKMIETNQKLYNPNNENRGDLARKLGIDYVVVSRKFTNTSNLENEDYRLCFFNDEIDIYKITAPDKEQLF